jgi:hypothetical protein
MIRFNERTGRYEVIVDGLVSSFQSLREAIEYVASQRER